MRWSDSGYVISSKPYGESSAIINIFSKEHGRHAGLVKGGNGKRLKGIIQPGNKIFAQWASRTSEQLGFFNVELNHPVVALIMTDQKKLVALSSACSMLYLLTAEREKQENLYEAFSELIDSIVNNNDWPFEYIRWEKYLLKEIGYGLDLDKCAVTGTTEALYYVSPKTGRAVCFDAGKPYQTKLLKLPYFLVGSSCNFNEKDLNSVVDGLRLTGYFLEKVIFNTKSIGLPKSRIGLLNIFKDSMLIQKNDSKK